MKGPAWNDSLTDLGRYRLSNIEMLQRRAATVSKNKEAARAEWTQKQEMLKQGIVPKEVREVMRRPKPQPVKKECKSTLKRSSTAQPTISLGKTQQSRYSGLRTTAVDPQAATIKQEATVSEAKKPLESDPFESLKRLDDAMSQLESAMASAIEDPVQKYEVGERTEIADPHFDESEVSESSVFSLSPDHSQELFLPHPYMKVPVNQDIDEYATPLPSWQEYDENNPLYAAKTAHFPSSNPAVPTQIEDFPLYETPGNPTFISKPADSHTVNSGFQSREEDFPHSQTPENAAFSESLEEPNICSVETADYLQRLLEQTRKDLEDMHIPNPSPAETSDPYSDLPALKSLGRNYDSDLMPRPYVLKPASKEISDPVVRGSGIRGSNSFAIGSNLGPQPQKYVLKPGLR